MTEVKSSFWLYLCYRFLFAFLLICLSLSAIEKFICGTAAINEHSLWQYLILASVFLLLQVTASLTVFRATVNKDIINLNNGKVIPWNDVQYVTRLRYMYVLKIKNAKRYYLFPVERQVIWLLGDKVEYTQMDQIIKRKISQI